jgi:hypothetical protein
MASVTATDFINVMGISDTATDMEYVLDLAIDTLNLYGATAISNMAGDAGSKTVTLTSRQRGGVFHVARIIYHETFKKMNVVTVATLALTTPELLSNPTIVSTIEKIAKKLGTVDFLVGEDTSGIE